PTTISSTIVVRHGTSSSISLGASCPSDCANGPTGSDQWDLVLPLTEEQLALVRAAANAVPPRWREHYLAAIADLLTGRPRITNHELAALLLVVMMSG